jgi:UTP:GlnB (protein PII) uridylyltransferase
MNEIESPVSLLRKRKQELIARFLKGDEPSFPERHAEILDDYFFETFVRSSVGPRMRVDKNPYAIIALGGYGRKEQCIHSDVDVLLLFKKKIPGEAKGLVKEIFYPMWDIGLDVGYATRSLKECSTLASRDFEVLTSLIDARFVCGISLLYSDLMEQLNGKVLRGHGRAYIDWLSERNRDRHARFGDSTYRLEPNLKEGRGGLRDYHGMLWIARATYHISEPRDLEFLGHLSHNEFESLCEALSFITTVRNRLHHLSARQCDQLYFEYQVKLAQDLGFKQENGQHPVEGFLGRLHGQMAFLKREHLMFLNRVVGARRKSGKKKAPRRMVTAGIQVVHHALHFESPEAILERPALLIRIIVVQCARNLRDTERLKMLYLLTVADSRATGPKAWNDWKAVLLKELFFKVRHILNKGELATPAAAEVVEKKKKGVLHSDVSLSGKALETLFDQIKILFMIVAMLGIPVMVWAGKDVPTVVSNAEAIKGVQAHADYVWTLVAAALVFFMQPGFAMVEAGFTRAKNAVNILMKNLLDFSMGSIFFWAIGFGLMFGTTKTGWFGTSCFFLSDFSRNFSKIPGTLEVMVTSLRARRTASLRPPMP